MSLITRCPICATAFKVVPDQLRISDGWVRCGRCGEVFDAAVGLQQAEALGTLQPMPPDSHPANVPRSGDGVAEAGMDAEAPDASNNALAAAPNLRLAGADRWSPVDAEPEVVPVVKSALPRLRASELPDISLRLTRPPVGPADIQRLSIGLVNSPSATPTLSAPERGAGPAPMPVVRRAAEVETGPNPTAAIAAAVIAAPAPAASVAVALGPRAVPGKAPAPADRSPSFLATPLRVVGSRRPQALVGLALLAILATVLLAGQLLRHERDVLAARQPALRPLLDMLCRFTGCAVAAPRQIAAFSVDGASFSREPDGGTGYRLYFSLRNSATLPLAMPAIELTLLDTQERPVLRRVLLPADFGAPPTLPALTERATSLRLSLNPLASGSGSFGIPTLPSIAGYHVDPFYP